MYPKSYLYHIRHGKIGPRPNNLLEFEQKKKKKKKKKKKRRYGSSSLYYRIFKLKFLLTYFKFSILWIKPLNDITHQFDKQFSKINVFIVEYITNNA